MPHSTEPIRPLTRTRRYAPRSSLKTSAASFAGGVEARE